MRNGPCSHGNSYEWEGPSNRRNCLNEELPVAMGIWCIVRKTVVRNSRHACLLANSKQKNLHETQHLILQKTPILMTIDAHIRRGSYVGGTDHPVFLVLMWLRCSVHCHMEHSTLFCIISAVLSIWHILWSFTSCCPLPLSLTHNCIHIVSRSQCVWWIVGRWIGRCLPMGCPLLVQ